MYVNDFEIFRPQLIRSGQQEGLSFPNIDLIRDLEFSSGGFEARYGDKMSSVLDIRYKRPESHKYSISASLLGMSAHMEGSKKIGSNAYNKLRYLLGLRYKSNAYLLGSGDIKGEYVPRFIDIQGYVSYDLTKDVQVSFISNYNGSEYNFEPSSGTSNRGTFDFQLQLNTTFEGSEQSQFRYGMSGLGLTYVPEKSRHPLYLKLHASAYNAIEEEKFDILGFYRLSQVETGLGSNAGQEIAVLGSGTQHLYARNFLVNAIYNVEHKGGIEWRNQTSSVDRSHFLQWGVKLQRENFDDQLLEWERLDSAGYSLPYTGQAVALFNAVRTDNVVVNDRLTAFVQNSYSLENTTTVWKVTGGVRALYRSLSQEFLVSPRAQILFQPKGINKNIAFKIAGGMYHQAPLYRELRRMDGTINKDLLSQKSWQIVGGMSYDFTLERISNRPFKIISEVYYKQMYDLISYEIDNVRIRYAGQNNSDGYVLGWDFRINGEFVPGAESWLSFSFMTAREALRGINHLRYERVGEEVVESIVDNVPRPTDRLYNVNLFFQDYLPKNENVKVNLNFSFGGGLPYGPRIGNDVFRNFFRLKSYHRVDIGFSFQIWKEEWRNKKPNHPLKFSSNTWLSIEAFNLLDIANQASVNWVRTLSNIEYALPNNLTGRRVNVRMRMDF